MRPESILVTTTPQTPTLGDASAVGVLLMDAQLRPKWLYRYPRVPSTLATTRLVGDPTGQQMYLVDLANERVVALPR